MEPLKFLCRLIFSLLHRLNSCISHFFPQFPNFFGCLSSPGSSWTSHRQSSTSVSFETWTIRRRWRGAPSWGSTRAVSWTPSTRWWRTFTIRRRSRQCWSLWEKPMPSSTKWNPCTLRYKPITWPSWILWPCCKMLLKSILFYSLTSFPPQILSGVILEVLSEDLGDCFTDEVQMAWTKMMALLYWHITGAYQEVGWVKLSSSAVWDAAPSTQCQAWSAALLFKIVKRSDKSLL